MTVELRAGAFAIVFLILAGPASAQSIETRGGHCNDGYFDSDGAGISGCLEYGFQYDNTHIFGLGMYGATPETKNGSGTDPLDEVARIVAWYGQEFETDNGIHYSIAGRAGIEGGLADDITLDVKEFFHDLLGFGNTNLVSTKETTFIGGVSGWGRKDMLISQSDAWTTSFTPYAHAALGNDTLEGGGGIMLSLQPAGESESLALLMPKNGAYAPTFGGDGLGVFAGVRGVAIETLYDTYTNHFLAEAGVTAQWTLWDAAVFGISGSCTTEPYDGADKADCKATFQMGGLF